MVLPEGAASGGNGEGASDGDHPVAWVPLAGDEDLVEHLRPDEIEVMAEELGMAMGHGPVPIDTVDLEDVESAIECEEEEEASEAAAAPLPEAAAAASVEATHIEEECVKAAITSPARYISCPFGKWAETPCIRRVTTWPASQSIANRSVSLKCYFLSLVHLLQRKGGQSAMTFCIRGYSFVFMKSMPVRLASKLCLALAAHFRLPML